jgi:hypothetical protein
MAFCTKSIFSSDAGGYLTIAVAIGRHRRPKPQAQLGLLRRELRQHFVPCRVAAEFGTIEGDRWNRIRLIAPSPGCVRVSHSGAKEGSGCGVIARLTVRGGETLALSTISGGLVHAQCVFDSISNGGPEVLQWERKTSKVGEAGSREARVRHHGRSG